MGNFCDDIPVFLSRSPLNPNPEVALLCQLSYCEGLFGKNGTVPSGDRFCCGNGHFLRFETEGKGRFVWGNGAEPPHPNKPWASAPERLISCELG